MADKLSDELLKRIAGGSGRCYGYEGRAMAAELLEWRAKAAAAAQAASATGSASSAHPLWGIGGGTP